ncbi:MAG: ATP-grasp domain-containing protein [Deltaproteobacteria bacterium]|nr:ATP-grasp domain-containing protein [Deltaproteobacteria bacterium]
MSTTVVSVLVTGAGGGVGEGIIKALRMIRGMEIRIVAADMSHWAAGLYAGDVMRLVPRASAPGYIDAIIAICKAEGCAYYLPGTDVELAVCAANAERIERESGAHVVISSPAVVRIADDKHATARFLEKHGLAFPRTFLREEWRAGALPFPLIVKPRVGCRSIGVELVRDEHELVRALARSDEIVLQERLGDDDTEYTCTVVSCRGEPSRVVVLQRWLRAGDTYRVVPVQDERIEAYVLQTARALAALGARGSTNFQLRLDGGAPKIFELNARFSGTTPLCAELGMNPVESYLKRHRGMSYDGSARTDVVILRHWAELIVPRAAFDALARDGRAAAPAVERGVL